MQFPSLMHLWVSRWRKQERSVIYTNSFQRCLPQRLAWHSDLKLNAEGARRGRVSPPTLTHFRAEVLTHPGAHRKRLQLHT
jgi:hypothetical protein